MPTAPSRRHKPILKRLFLLSAWSFLAACGAMSPTQVITPATTGNSEAVLQPATPNAAQQGDGANAGTASADGNTPSRTPPDDTRAQPAPLAGGVFAPGPNPDTACMMKIAATSSVQCVQSKSGRENVTLQGTVNHLNECAPSEKSSVLRVVNNVAGGAEFIDILVNRNESFQASLAAKESKEPHVWEFYLLVPSPHTPTFLSLGDPAVTTYEMIPCRDDLCVVGEGRNPLDATVQVEKKNVGGSVGVPPPECATPKMKELKTLLPPKNTNDGVYELLN